MLAPAHPAVRLDKLRSVIGYFASAVSPGKVKLFKLLYLADFTARAELGHSITGDMYESFPMGPVPLTVWNNFEELVQQCAQLNEIPTGFGLPEQSLSAKAGFEPEFDDDEKEILERIIQQYGHMSGNQLKELTHDTIPYRATRRGDSIPYGLAGYLDYRKPTRKELQAAVLDNPERMADLESALHGVE